MKDNKTRFSQEELTYFETDYFNKLMKYLSENKNKTEVHFIKSELKIIENSEKEKNDLFKSNDNDFYDFLINNDHFKYKRILEESKNKEETKRQILENHLQRERQNFAPSEINNINKRKEFYKIKLETIQRNIKQAQEIKEAEVKEKHPKENNKFDWIFSNNGYELFSYILENHIAKKGIRGRINDLSFYYWSMFNSTPRYIHQRPEVFKRWFCEKYEDNFSKIKTYYEANDKKGNRKRHFQTSLDWFKNQK